MVRRHRIGAGAARARFADAYAGDMTSNPAAVTTRIVPPAVAHDLVRTVCDALGSDEREARLVADHLVAANLAGHDSHGVGMIPTYVGSAAAGGLVVNAELETVTDAGAVLVVDGVHGFGQAMAFDAMAVGIERAREYGLALVGLRNSHHVGRIGHWAEQCAAAGLISIHFVNVGGSLMVAPFGGSDARFSTNPFCVAFPRVGEPTILLDFATSAIAYGKARVAHNKGVEAPEGSLIDHEGRPTDDPSVLFDEPHGALRAMGLHKGGGLAIMCELLGGALTGGLTTREETAHDATSIYNSMTSILIDPNALGSLDSGAADAFLEWVKASPAPAGAEHGPLLPGEVERATRATRTRDGLPVDETTWRGIADAARAAGVPDDDTTLAAWNACAAA